MSGLFNKHKDKILYLFFGGCTTLINTTAYYILYEKLTLSNITGNTIAWVIAVLFAYITNKIWVFESSSTNVKTLVCELRNFFSCRLATAIIDLAIMIVGVDLLKWNVLLMKIISNLIVIVLNYLLSERVVFRKDVDSSSD